MFKNRLDAAAQLSARLTHYRGQHPLVLAIPRGGVPLGELLAHDLEGDLDLVLARKISHPLLPEYALGAIGESGWTYYSPAAASFTRHAGDLDVEKLRQLDLIRQRRATYLPRRDSIDPSGRVVIVVDDGVATGATMIAAVHELRMKNPARLICAVPVASVEALRSIRPDVDEMVCIHTPLHFEAISPFYQDFPQVSDEEVKACLNRHPPATKESIHEHQANHFSRGSA